MGLQVPVFKYAQKRPDQLFSHIVIQPVGWELHGTSLIAVASWYPYPSRSFASIMAVSQADELVMSEADVKASLG